jgi:selenocysteine lyase/cysteine desulfurase
VARHEHDLISAMIHGIGDQRGVAAMPGVVLIGAPAAEGREGVVSLYHRTVASADLVSRLAEKGVRVHIRKNDHYCGNILGPLGVEDCIRVSVCHYNSLDEVQAFLAGMEYAIAG